MEAILSPIVQELAKYALIALFTIMLSRMRKLFRVIKLIDYKLQATDFALEQSFKNGYADHRNQKLKELLEADKFIKT
jgi:hypothetical protein